MISFQAQIAPHPRPMCYSEFYGLRTNCLRMRTHFSAGNWILDNFPHTREQFNVMVERGIVPDNLICLKDNSEGGKMLLKRWYQLNKQGIFKYFK